jgi:hypothetical protein
MNSVAAIGVLATIWGTDLNVTIAMSILVIALTTTATAYQFHLIGKSSAERLRDQARESASHRSHTRHAKTTEVSLEEIKANLAMSDAELIHRGTLRERTRLLSAEMFRFLTITEHTIAAVTRTIETPDGGRMTMSVPDSGHIRDLIDTFDEFYLDRVRDIIKELATNGIPSDFADDLKYYKKDFHRLYWLSHHLAKVADRLPEQHGAVT